MIHVSNFIAHCRAITECLTMFEARAALDMESLKLEVRARGRSVELIPQFIMPSGQSISFTPKLVAESTFFLGWRPYFHRVWPLAVDKLEFKKYCQENGIATPGWYESAAGVEATVLLKRTRASFGQGLRAPLTPADVRSLAVQPAQGEFFEQFVLGDIAKVWYWNDRPACIDVMAMPHVVGDGRRTLKQLIAAIRSSTMPADWQTWEAMARFQQLALDQVVDTGRRVLADFRYLSPLHSPGLANQNALGKYAGTPVLQALTAAGPKLWETIPEALRDNTMFTADAIIDADQRVWFLEINCNSAVHPDVYPLMFASLFGAPGERRVDWSEYSPTFKLPLEPAA
jgi:hypothetical protein